MTHRLPEPVERYFAGKNARDFDAAVSSFLPAAVVKDEGRLHEGPVAIRAWMQDTAAKYDDQAEVKSFVRRGRSVEVAAEVSGTFPGSPATLRFRFTLDGDRIGRLEIGS
jgi:hypothetical protein